VSAQTHEFEHSESETEFAPATGRQLRSSAARGRSRICRGRCDQHRRCGCIRLCPQDATARTQARAARLSISAARIDADRSSNRTQRGTRQSNAMGSQRGMTSGFQVRAPCAKQLKSNAITNHVAAMLHIGWPRVGRCSPSNIECRRLRGAAGRTPTGTFSHKSELLLLVPAPPHTSAPHFG
jgi:hypothetical protein